MRYGSVCSGIEAASLAWEQLGWSAAWFAEIEAFPSRVLAHRWPHVPNLGDMCRLPEYLRMGLIEAPDVLVGGTPCQAFSVAGLRQGLVDPRGELTIKYAEVADAIDSQRPDDPCVVVWENVPGVLSDKGNAFGCFLGALVGEECALEPAGKKWTNAGVVYGPQRSAAWRILDAQYFGVAQRRRRVFVVASARKGFDPAKVLFEFEGVRRDTAPSRKTGEEIAGTFKACAGTSGGWSNSADHAAAGYMIPVAYANRGYFGSMTETDTADPLRSKGGDTGHGGESIICMAHGQAGAEIRSDGSPSLTCNHEAPIVFSPIAFAENSRAEVRLEGGDGDRCGALSAGGGKPGQGVPCVAFQSSQSGVRLSDVHATLDSNNGSRRHNGVVSGWSVRRLTPLETERLQGMPDGHTDVPGAADGPRYKSIGNSKAVPVVRWLGGRL